jgi:hypothetical protein
MKINSQYTFSKKEESILRGRISGEITESECSKLLGKKRQYVNFMVARFVMQMFIDGKLIIK